MALGNGKTNDLNNSMTSYLRQIRNNVIIIKNLNETKPQQQTC